MFQVADMNCSPYVKIDGLLRPLMNTSFDYPTSQIELVFPKMSEN